jgi:uncharacterized protein (DUF2147 family)
VIKAIIRITTGIVLFAAGISEAGEEEILGIWNNDDGRAKIEIFHCGECYCGKIVWLKQPLYPADDPQRMGGTSRVDRDNPVPELRSRRIQGLQIMEGFIYKGVYAWDNGRIYDPDSGQTYKSKIKLVSPRHLDIRGYVGIPFFGRTTTWTR